MTSGGSGITEKTWSLSAYQKNDRKMLLSYVEKPFAQQKLRKVS